MSTLAFAPSLAPPATGLLAEIGLPEVIGSAAGLGLTLLFLMLTIRKLLFICQPNEVLIFTGRKRVKDGVDLGPMVILPHGTSGQAAEYSGGGRGRAWRIPVIERVDRMDITTLSIDVVVHNAYSKGNIPLRIHAIANVKVHSDPRFIRNAIERFLGRDRNEIYVVAQQTLEGALREVVAQMTPEEVNEDRLTFAENLSKSVADDLEKLGLELDTLKVQNVADDTGYLDSLGRPRIARVLRDAENAENQALQETTQAEADSKRRSESAKADAETRILETRNALAKLKAELDGTAEAVEREAIAAAKTARAEAEQELQKTRAQLEEKRLQADVVIPAEIQREARIVLAKGDAAPTIEDGKAVVHVLEATAEAWRSMGDKAKEIYVIQHLEEIMKAVVERMQAVDVGEVNVLDPGDGSGLSSYAASYPQAIAAVLRALAETTGIDVPGTLRGDGQGPTGPVAPQRPTPGPAGGAPPAGGKPAAGRMFR